VRNNGGNGKGGEKGGGPISKARGKGGRKGEEEKEVKRSRWVKEKGRVTHLPKNLKTKLFAGS